jgi:CheY-like chemotaxis protein
MHVVEEPNELGCGAILVAEDDPEMRRVVVETLRGAGHRVLEYDNGDRLCAALSHGGSPALIVVDILMPGCGGLCVLQRARQQGCTAPIVLITAFASEAVLNEAIASGASLVLSKPFAMEDLRTIVRCFLNAPA